jgi:hypothetical protein
MTPEEDAAFTQRLAALERQYTAQAARPLHQPAPDDGQVFGQIILECQQALRHPGLPPAHRSSLWRLKRLCTFMLERGT